MTMDVWATTLIALTTSLAAALAWVSAAMCQWNMNRGWAMLCLTAALLSGWFALVYVGILTGVVDSHVAGQTYLRPAMAALFLLLVAISMRFKRG